MSRTRPFATLIGASTLLACEVHEPATHHGAEIVADDSSWLFIHDRGLQLQKVRSVETAEAALAKLCAGESKLAVVLTRSSDSPPRCPNDGIVLETQAVAELNLLLAVHRENTWMQPVERGAWRKLSKISKERLPKWSDIDPTWSSDYIDLYAPGEEHELHETFERAVGWAVARGLAPSPVECADSQYCDDHHALAFLSKKDAEKCSMRVIESRDPDRPTQFTSTLFLARRSGAPESDTSWNTAVQVFSRAGAPRTALRSPSGR